MFNGAFTDRLMGNENEARFHGESVVSAVPCGVYPGRMAASLLGWVYLGYKEGVYRVLYRVCTRVYRRILPFYRRLPCFCTVSTPFLHRFSSFLHRFLIFLHRFSDFLLLLPHGLLLLPHALLVPLVLLFYAYVTACLILPHVTACFI